MGVDEGLELCCEAGGAALVEVAGVAEVFGGKVVVAGAVDVFKVDVGELVGEGAEFADDEGVVGGGEAVGVAGFAVAAKGMGGWGEEQDLNAFLIDGGEGFDEEVPLGLVPGEADDVVEVVEEFGLGGGGGDVGGVAIGTRGRSVGLGAGGADFGELREGDGWGGIGDGPEFGVVLEVVAAAVAVCEEIEAIGVAALGVEVAGANAPEDPFEIGEGEEVVFGEDGLQFHVAAGRREVEGAGGLGGGVELAGEDADAGAGVAEGDEAELGAEFPVEPHLFGDGGAVLVAEAGGDGLGGGGDFDVEGGVVVVEFVGLEQVVGTADFVEGEDFGLDDLAEFGGDGLFFGVDDGPVGELDFGGGEFAVEDFFDGVGVEDEAFGVRLDLGEGGGRGGGEAFEFDDDGFGDGGGGRVSAGSEEEGE